jgi:hypothetical protein
MLGPPPTGLKRSATVRTLPRPHHPHPPAQRVRSSARSGPAPGVPKWLGWVDFCLSAYGRQCMEADLVDMRAFNQLGSSPAS